MRKTSYIIFFALLAVQSASGVSFLPPTPNTNLEARIAQNLPRREDALRLARSGRVFLASDTVTFSFVDSWNEDEYPELERQARLDVRVEDLFGVPPLRKGHALEKVSSEQKVLVEGGRQVRMRYVSWRFTMEDNPGCGLWRVLAKLASPSNGPSDEASTVFEVLPDESSGQCPPIASKLPVFLPPPNDAWRDWGVMGFDPFLGGGNLHYYSIGACSAEEGVATCVWDALSPYRRKWMCVELNGKWASGKIDESLAEALRHADVFCGANECYDFTRPSCYRGAQLCILRDYLVEKRPPLKLLTLAEINLRIGRCEALSRAEFEEMFSTCWDDFLAFANSRRADIARATMDRLVSVKPDIARCSTMPVVLDRCRSPYSLLMSSILPEDDPRMRGSGSFFLLADNAPSAISGVPPFRRMRRNAYFVAGYLLNFGGSRLLYPELDFAGASHLAAFRFAYGSACFRGGEYRAWSDGGFFVHDKRDGNPPSRAFLKAWGEVLRHQPIRAAKSPYAVVDFDAFRRAGDALLDAPAAREPVVFNRADEAVGRVCEQCAESGYLPPVLTTLSEVERLLPENAEFVILPPLVGTPPAVLDAIRDANARGIGLLGLGRADGLEEVFGVRASHSGYKSDGAETVSCGAGALAFVRKPSVRAGRTAFLPVPLEDGAMKDILSKISPRPAVKTD